ncbi:leucine-rich repeat domain-containing protein [Flavobacterium supellecticarium]|uniref:leucine-rich repeat domain-containing protein n=1 Tax=Flavobacterium supellecticarium TaxID=2565924 RepID=UPI001E3D1557|nr:hypothetical protein [Flavobacterium supellecticarium]
MKKLYFLVMALCFFTAANAQIINIPDPNFKALLLQAGITNDVVVDPLNYPLDADMDGEITVLEAARIGQLYISNASLSDLTGIEHFTNLIYLECLNNNITALDVSSNTTLKWLNCENNLLTSLDVSHNLDLQVLDFSKNNIATIDLSQNVRLDYLRCEHTLLTALNTSNNLLLGHLDCRNSLITELDLSQNVKLEAIRCSSNPIVSLDLSNNPLESEIYCGGDALESLNIKNGKQVVSYDEFHFKIQGPDLRYVCVDEQELSSVQAHLTSNGYSNFMINSYCSFTPGGEYFTVNGQIKYDHDNNGCNDMDINPTGMRFSITSGANSIGTMITDSTGNYSLPLSAGNYTIQPNFENAYYFNIQPPVVYANLSAQTNPLEQNFCITANGVYQDLEIVLIPVSPARPGFDADYKLIYKNKGNQTQSGTVNFVFNDAVLDLVMVNPVATTQTTDNLS